MAPNCFGDNDKYNLWYLIVEQDVCRIYLNENHGFDQRKAPNSKSAFSTQVKAYIHFNFEFEYRKHRSIKGDAN